MSQFFEEFETLQNSLNDVKDLINKTIDSSNEPFRNSVLEAFDGKAKMIRPAMTLICANYGDNDRDETLKVAAAMEMLHVASLVHDDIIDDAKTRRGNPSIQAKYGKDYAVIMGDYLFAKSFSLIFETNRLDSIKMAGDSVVKMTFGEIDQYFEKRDLDLSIDKYLTVISGKTAALFAMNCFIGANVGNLALDVCEKFKRFGETLGLAFQIQDDLLDFEASNTTKDQFHDIESGIYTLPLIIAASESKTLYDLLISRNIKQNDYDFIKDEVVRTNALAKAYEMADNYFKEANFILDSLKDCESKQQLRFLSNKIYSRKY